MTASLMIHGQFCSIAHACTRIVQVANAEKNGQTAMTPSTIDPSTRMWFYRKRFLEDDDIYRVEAEAGTLAVGLLMLMHAAPRCPSEFNIKGANLVASPRKKKAHRVFVKHKVQAIQTLYHDQNKPVLSNPSSNMSANLGHRDRQQAGISGDELEQHVLETVSNFDKIADLEEFKDALAADEQDSAERSEISSEYGGEHKITVKGSSLTRTRRSPRNNPSGRVLPSPRGQVAIGFAKWALVRRHSRRLWHQNQGPHLHRP